MNQNKIEKFTDKLFLQQKLNQSSPKLLSNRSQQVSYKSSCRSSTIKPVSTNRQIFRDQKQRQGLSKTDIDKLQLMCADLTAQDYLNKLILIHQQENSARFQQELQFTIQNQWGKFQNSNFSEPKKQGSSNALLIKHFDGKDQIKQQSSPNNFGKITKNIKKQKLQKQDLKSTKYQSNKKKIIQNNLTMVDRKKSFVFVNKTSNQEKKMQKNHDKYQIKVRKQKKQLESSNQFDKKYDNEKKNLASIIQSDNFYCKKNNEQLSYQLKNNYSSNQNNYLIPQSYQQKQQKLNYKLQMPEQEFKQENEFKYKSLEQICYVQIGKRMVTVTQKQIRRQFFKTNLHIRSYLMRNIVEYIKYLAQFSPNSIYILPNERALHFQPNVKPDELNQYLQHTKYVQIIRNVNHIIQKNIFKQKYFEKQPDYWPYFMFGMFILLIIMLILVVFVGDENLGLKNIFMVCTGLLICILLVVLIGYSLSCYRQQTKFRPVCEIIYEDIDSYFKFINGKMQNDIEWIIGQSFFWIQVKIKNTHLKNVTKNGKLGRLKNRNYLYHNNLEEEMSV